MALPKLQQIIVSPRVVKPRDYTLAGNTINALNERHDAALAQRSAIANDLAKNYVLHESEDKFKTDFTNEMLGRIDEKIDAVLRFHRSQAIVPEHDDIAMTRRVSRIGPIVSELFFVE